MDREIWKMKNIVSGEILDISKSVFKVGRNVQADLASVHGSVSRNHATLFILIDGLHVQDHKSCNGTFVNDIKIVALEMKKLSHGDVVGFGCCEKIYQDHEFGSPPLIFQVTKVERLINISEPRNNKRIIVTDAIDLTTSESSEDVLPFIPPNRGFPKFSLDQQINEPPIAEGADQANFNCKIETIGGEDKVNSEVKILEAPVICNDLAEPSSTTNVTSEVKIVAAALATEAQVKLKEEVKVTEAPIKGDSLESNLKKETMERQLDIEDETLEPPNIKQNTFSVNDDDCIVISDNEESDDAFGCSQIFYLSEKIKKEQVSVMDGEDPYAEIKKELEDLDYCDNGFPLPIDLTTEEKPLNDTMDLINMLESPSTSANAISAQIRQMENDIGEVPTTSSAKQTIPDSKYVKPPVVAPHSEIKPNPRKDANLLNAKKPKKENKQTEGKKKPTKRQSSTEPSPVAKKKLKAGNSFVDAKCDKKSIDNEFSKRSGSAKTKIDKDSKDLIMMERKKKLKEISDKVNQKSRGDVTEKPQKIVGKVKSSESRGTFLSNSPKVTPKYGHGVESAPHTSKSTKLCNPEDSAAAKSVVKKTRTSPEIQDTTITSNFSPTSDNNRSPLSHCAAANNKPQTNGPRPDSTMQEDRSGLIWKTPATYAHQRQNIGNHHRSLSNIDDDITKIVHWYVIWLTEQHHSDISPPVNDTEPPQIMPLKFNKYADYVSVVPPLIMLELWQYVYETMYNKDETRIAQKMYLRHKRNVARLTYLDCECYLSEEDVRKNNVIRTDDFVLVEMKIKRANNCTCFGYIKYCYRTNVKTDASTSKQLKSFYPDIKAHTHLKFTVVLRNSINKDIDGDHQVIVKVIANVASYMKLFRTVKYLGASPICQQVLDPCVQDYEVIATEKKLVVEVKLNDQQRQIVLEACTLCLGNKPGLYLIKGPPGTGKSNVIVNIILQTIFSSANLGKKPPLILLTAPSNAAVDGVILKLAETRAKLPVSQRKYIKLVRIGPDSSISAKVDKFKLSSLARNNVVTEHGFINSEEYKMALDNNCVEQFLKKKLGQHYFYKMKCGEDALLFNSNIICTTLNSCVSSRILDPTKRELLKFSCCIIDEATQCNEVESLLPLQLGIEKFVIVGDPQQLPAVVVNKDAKNLGYGKSLFSRIDKNFQNQLSNPIKMLNKQYRMRQEICEYPNRTFYEGKLESIPLHTNKITPAIKPYLVFNLNRVEAKEGDYEYTSFEEAQFICKLLETLKQCVHTTCKYSIGIITPYKAQKELLIRNIAGIRFNENVSLTVNTVDSFQGIENDIIIISSVRYSTNYFLQNEQRLNVALTRARQALYIIGNYQLFKHCKPLYDLREDAKRRKLLVDLKDYPKNLTTLRKYIVDW